jgi:hypothetical protein
MSRGSLIGPADAYAGSRSAGEKDPSDAAGTAVLAVEVASGSPVGKALGVKTENAGSTPAPAKPFRAFEWRWAEPLGRPECPYVYRWVLTLFGYSVRLHHWIGSDDLRHFHDHPWDFISIILKGRYLEITPEGMRVRTVGDVARYRAEHRHKVQLIGRSCWTCVLSKRHRRHFGFYVPGRETLLRPLRYFSRYGLHPCE